LWGDAEGVSPYVYNPPRWFLGGRGAREIPLLESLLSMVIQESSPYKMGFPLERKGVMKKFFVGVSAGMIALALTVFLLQQLTD
jgi:hypothetical protein